ncbi:NAD(P)/FAD-dependent oxidoreductase [Candidatus Nitrosotenuis uzonensis]|uniref:Dehydrogenase (Flavoprotein)-like protein n=1 Tax=Candidatus Nitrosotenuis uzonensis TaxID=1407055 RepID=A0A812EXB9_9ARCH|nr:NAD(P)/FAD-dependent oxidoreductase [Candidatus Nitrosotenuis uzonensis]MCA2003420.1 NAD(P)/FAD-dependent oxidoreductase [Candidatus Nitrosotenuis sp.]CAE6496639.1 Dehydrogenase (Flavoprotein)-like protein [Candidatus Nitrosotenuis uzonensis]
MSFDVVVAGGSVAGLFCAREIAKSGHSVLVVEEDFEIGSPEHCGGLVSASGLEDLGIIPSNKTLDSQIEFARLISPSGVSVTVNAKKQNVLVINRREFDKQIALQAQKNGADIKVKTTLKTAKDGKAVTNSGTFDYKILVDARGVSSLVNKDRTGMLQSAQYEVYADWIEKGVVEVNFDAQKYPGFFSWTIPESNGIGKIGVAGRAINAMDAIEKILEQKGKHSVIRKVFAPIWVNGPIQEFIVDDTVVVGDAAGQSKPTTAGGIYSCGIGGIFAGRAIARFLNTGNRDALTEYRKSWHKKFGHEFEKQLFARKMLERLDNPTIDKLFSSITADMIKDISESDDFDFHTSAIVKILGLRGSLKMAQTIFGAEIKKLLS